MKQGECMTSKEMEICITNQDFDCDNCKMACIGLDEDEYEAIQEREDIFDICDVCLVAEECEKVHWSRENYEHDK